MLKLSVVAAAALIAGCSQKPAPAPEWNGTCNPTQTRCMVYDVAPGKTIFTAYPTRHDWRGSARRIYAVVADKDNAAPSLQYQIDMARREGGELIFEEGARYKLSSPLHVDARMPLNGNGAMLQSDSGYVLVFKGY